jgi:membrane-associated phospholipid phosphatase
LGKKDNRADNEKPMKRIVFLFCFLSLGFNLYSESVYTFDLKKDIIISAFTLGAVGASYFIPGTNNGIPDELNRNEVNFIDRGLMFPEANTPHHIRDKMRNWMPVLTVITPLSVWAIDGWGFDKKDFNTWLTYGIMYLQASTLTLETVEVLKKTVDRYRPRSYFDNSAGKLISNDCFPSDTTAFSFLISTLLSVTFSAEYPDSLWRIPVIAGSYTLAASIGVMGIISGMHFLTDVLAGIAIGSSYGWLIPFLHRRPNIDNGVSFHFTGNSGVISLRF